MQILKRVKNPLQSNVAGKSDHEAILAMQDKMLSDAKAWLQNNNKTWKDMKPTIRLYPAYMIGDEVQVEEDEVDSD